MHTPGFSRVLTSILVVCLVSLFVIVALPFHASASSTRSSTPSSAASPAVSTSCPAPGTARAAFMPSMTLGSHPTIVYIVNEGTFSQPTGTLKRYDVVTGGKVEIVKMPGTSMVSAVVSGNGQWLLFVAEVSGLFKLQLIRMDGQYLQTLYCNSTSGINEVEWTATRTLIMFVVTTNGRELVDLLNTTNGVLQTELAVPNNMILHTWLDTTRIYLTNTQIDQPPNIIYLLDIRKGPNQTLSDLATVFNGSFVDFDSSYDAQHLYTAACSCGQGGSSGPGSIAVQSATGSQTRLLYSSATDAITRVRAVLPTTLLFTIENFAVGGGGNQSHNGLWKIHTDGTGLTRLTTDPAGQFTGLTNFSQFPWSNVSRNGSQYALGIISGNSSNITYTLEYGSLNGGTPSVFASITNVQLSIVGWTTM
jgi:eukaryotic-like serine/threonine-protein kinase